MTTLASWAEPLARALLQEPVPRRWAHSQGVAARHTAWHPFAARTPTYHSCAIVKADERGLADALSSEFDPAPDVLASVLTYWT